MRWQLIDKDGLPKGDIWDDGIEETGPGDEGFSTTLVDAKVKGTRGITSRNYVGMTHAGDEALDDTTPPDPDLDTSGAS